MSATANITQFYLTLNGTRYGPFNLPNIGDPTGLLGGFDSGDVKILDALGNANLPMVQGTNGLCITFPYPGNPPSPPFTIVGVRFCNIEIGAVASRAPYWAQQTNVVGDIRFPSIVHNGGTDYTLLIEANAPDQTAGSNAVTVAGASANPAIVPNGNLVATRQADGRAWQLKIAAAGLAVGVCRVRWTATRGSVTRTFFQTVTVT